ncbi:box C/D snoRNA protein 1 [Episyrphus balteatus]|uniref:box C/D snoRNA protein 1 n=1 Tax=Episyrphus balteatus TaxID=286459 RepID=UPI002485D271|nr:box C/D snoRNA protein 1 [Episyrphus balteatus]
MKRHSEMDSDTDSTTSISSLGTLSKRLGKCEVCGANDAKYTCPKCEVKTCCLPCLQIHKKELECSGIRDPTKFIPLKKMTKMDFMSDYYFLEECTRFVEDRKRDRIKRYTRYNKVLPKELFRLRNAAAKRKTTIRFLLENFSRRKENTSYLNWKTDIIYWRVEWVFVNAENMVFVDEKCCEDDSLGTLLDKYVNEQNPEIVPKKKCLEYYQSEGIGNLIILLKAEGVKRSRNRFFRLDISKSLRDNLADKVLVEYPCIHVAYDKNTLLLDIIESDDDLEEENNSYRKTMDKLVEKDKPEKTKAILEKELIEKKRAERRIKREQLEKEPSNYLFSDEKLWDEISSSSDSDGGNITEEEEIPSCSSAYRKR